MADSGRSTAALPPTATEGQARAALAWNERAWPWSAYGPVVMAAVGAGVPVLGANLPRARMRDAMADVSLDAQLPPPAWQAQVAAVRDGHCGLLPDSQMQPMTRIQVARDREMARTVAQAAQAGPGGAARHRRRPCRPGAGCAPAPAHRHESPQRAHGRWRRGCRAPALRRPVGHARRAAQGLLRRAAQARCAGQTLRTTPGPLSAHPRPRREWRAPPCPR
jgi:hypothetical protein